jgi:hypothetical protein
MILDLSTVYVILTCKLAYTGLHKCWAIWETWNLKTIWFGPVIDMEKALGALNIPASSQYWVPFAHIAHIALWLQEKIIAAIAHIVPIALWLQERKP